ncbi:AsmA family protein [Marinomonas posidonica]|uniref:AsmA family protein n=1 Tax=Marinomonas posidonica (strain CECT 7376 / NCIMB 14433 / IVIA-Po-181) TaxID=491952 RepID=F6CZ33_MARPP|nr:AsmA family protein [Marinomonas posidonica]AEF53489.1 AsmA family protein [Marinomonas posidonica IVIA-Po-181]
MVWFKRFVYFVLILLTLIGLALAYVGLFVNPNDFKDELKNVAMEKANVRLRLEGDIGWSFFPWLGLEMENIGVAIGSDAEIVQFDRAEFGLAMLPLLEQKIQVNKVNLVNLKAHLHQNAQGEGNWQLQIPPSTSKTDANMAVVKGSSNVSASASQTAHSSDVKIPDIHLEELRIEKAQIVYRNEQTKQLIEADLDVQLKDVQWDKAWPMVMEASLTQSDLQGHQSIKVEASLNSQLTVFPERESLLLDALVVQASISGEAIPASPLEAKLSAVNVAMDLPQENLLIDGLSLSSMGVNLDAKVQAFEVLSDPKFSATLSVGAFNPRTLLTALQIPLPDMADSTALTKASANVALEGSLDELTVQPIAIVLDDTKIEANAVLSLSPLRWDVSIAGANLDLDRYLPDPVEAEAGVDTEAETKIGIEAKSTTASGKAQANPTEAELIPVELIRGLNGHVGLIFDDIQVKKLTIDQLALDTTQTNGVVSISPLEASLYQGKVSSQLRLDVRGNTPKIDIEPSVEAVQIQPFLIDLMAMDNIAGETFLRGDLTSQGNSVDALMSSLQGDLLVEIKQGALVGTNLTKSVCEGIASIRKKTLNVSQFGNDTPFETMRFPAHIVDGQISTPGLAISSVGLQVTGDGIIALPTQSLNYQVNVGIAGSQLDAACGVNETVTQLTFPVVCKGAFSDDPAGLCRPDLVGFGTLFADLAKQEAAQKLAEEKAKLKAELKQKEAELKAELKAKRDAEEARLKAELKAKREAEEERLKDKLKDKLKSLF